jgi:hypothetical protein
MRVLPTEWIGKHVADSSALDFICLLFEISDVWDDLIDKDKNVDNKSINDAFRKCLINLPVNSFYIRNFNILYPLVISTITSWETANVLHGKKDEGNIAQAYTLRKLLINVVVESVRIISGNDAALQASIDGWSASSNNDSYTKFLGE